MMIGEVHTGLAQHSTKLSGGDAQDLLTLWRGRRVRSSSRPIERAWSPYVPVGVHCPLPTRSGTRPQGIGTLATRLSLTGGRLLQASTTARLVPAVNGHRQAWSHYLARLGTVELLSRADSDDLASGHLRYQTPARGAEFPALLDLGSVTSRLLDSAQSSPVMDRFPPFRAPRSRFRFAVTWSGVANAELVIDDDLLRTFRVNLGTGTPPTDDGCAALVGLCEDVALHDWLLTTAVRFLDISRTDCDDDAETFSRLRPVVKHLLPLWMPGAGVGDDLLPIWQAIEHRPGFSRQWNHLATNIRDRIALTAVSSQTYKTSR